MKGTLQVVADALGEAKVRYLLVGGWAVNAYGVARLTRDADLLLMESDYDQAYAALRPFGYTEQLRTAIFARLLPPSPMLMVIDLLFADADTFGRLWSASGTTEAEDRTHRIPALDHLLAMKLHALRVGQARRRAKDLVDTLELAAAGGLRIDSARFRELCARFGTPEIFSELLRMEPRP